MGASKKSDDQECRWELVRQDDNGNRHIVDVFLSEKEALTQMSRYESQGHKQAFWVQKTEGVE